MMQKAFVEGLSKGMQVDPAAEAARRREAAENAKRLDAAHQAEVQAVEAQRLQAARRQAVSRKVHGQELSQALQGLPGTQDRGLALSMPGNTSQGLSAGRQLKSAVFHGERALQAASPEAMRDEASRGFDQPGQHAGRLVKPVPKPVNLENIPSEKMTPKIKQFVDERAANRKKKQAAEEKLATLRAKQKLEPNETVEVVKLQQEISTAQNKENYYNFSINEALTKPASDGK